MAIRGSGTSPPAIDDDNYAQNLRGELLSLLARTSKNLLSTENEPSICRHRLPSKKYRRRRCRVGESSHGQKFTKTNLFNHTLLLLGGSNWNADTASATKSINTFWIRGNQSWGMIMTRREWEKERGDDLWLAILHLTSPGVNRYHPLHSNSGKKKFPSAITAPF